MLNGKFLQVQFSGIHDMNPSFVNLSFSHLNLFCVCACVLVGGIAPLVQHHLTKLYTPATMNLLL